MMLTGEIATDRCLQEKRKTINGEDILFAMSTLGFDNYAETMKLYLEKYREVRVCQTYIFQAFYIQWHLL